MPAAATGRLFVVSTPIGHLGDLSRRAIEVLTNVAVVAAEDTRHSRTLLNHYAIATPLVALHEHNEARQSPRLVQRMRSGEDVALISDAGTPLLSDPGLRLARAAIEGGIEIVAVPGASALLAALVCSGLDPTPFTFFGFLARAGAERAAALAAISALPHTGVLYEAPGRVAATLRDLALAGCQGREAVVARELTKQYEEVRRGLIEELAATYSANPPKGEVVILIAGRSEAPVDEASLQRAADAMLADGHNARDVATTLREQHNAPRNVAYRLAHRK